MASSLTDTLENRMLDWANPAVALPTRPTSPLKVALYTVMPNPETGVGGTEVVGFAYARATIVFPLASSGATSNTSAVTFATATGGGSVQKPVTGREESGGVSCRVCNEREAHPAR